MPQSASTPAPGYGSSSSGSSGASTPAPLGDQALTEEAQRRYMAEEDERRKKRRTFQGRMRELEEVGRSCVACSYKAHYHMYVNHTCNRLGT